jgi:hypothetical protein
MKKIPRVPTSGDVPVPQDMGGYSKKVSKKITGSATRYSADNIKDTRQKGSTRVIPKKDYQ